MENDPRPKENACRYEWRDAPQPSTGIVGDEKA